MKPFHALVVFLQTSLLLYTQSNSQTTDIISHLQANLPFTYTGPSFNLFSNPLHSPLPLPPHPNSCLQQINSSFMTEFGWSGHISHNPIVLEVQDWSSSKISSLVVFYILRDIMGYRNVTLFQRNRLLASNAGTEHAGDNPVTRCAKGFYHINVERWPFGYREDIKEFMEQRKLCTDLGDIGYEGREGIYLSNKALDVTKSAGYPDFYRSLVETPDLFDVFEKINKSPEGVCEQAYCSDVSADGKKQRWLSSKCKQDRSKCAKLYHAFPTWAATVIESMAETLELPIGVEYYHGEQQAILSEALADGKVFLLYGWTPSTFVSNNNVTRISFKENSRKCYSSLNSVNITNISCDFPVNRLRKYVWSELERYEPVVYNLIRKLDILEEHVVTMMEKELSNGGNASAAVCEWMRSNKDVWSLWVPSFPTKIQFETIRMDVSLPQDVIYVPVMRSEGSKGVIKATVGDASNSKEGRSLLEAADRAPAVEGTHFKLSLQESNNETLTSPINSAVSAFVLVWNDGQLGNVPISITLIPSDDSVENMGIVLMLGDLVADSGSFGTHTLISIIFNGQGCEEGVPGKKGGMALFDNFTNLWEFSKAGTVFSIVFLSTFLLEFGVLLIRFLRKSNKRKITDANASSTTFTPGHKRTAVSSFFSEWKAYCTLHFEYLHGLSYPVPQLVETIHPRVTNIYPIVACFTDFIQITSIILAPDLPWLNGSVASDVISLSSLTFLWYFWLLSTLTLTWILYIIFLLSGLEGSIEQYFIGRLLLLPSVYIIPFGATILFIPSITMFFRLFTCVLEEDLIHITPRFTSVVVNDHCSLQCWAGIHWAYASFAGCLLITYFPLAFYTAPLWQTIQGDMLEVKYKQRFFLIDSLTKSVLVFCRMFVRQHEGVFYAVVLLSLLFYLTIFTCHNPCTVPWVSNLRVMFLLLLVFYTFIAILSVEHSHSESIWPFTFMTVVTAVAGTCYIYYDRHAYPEKFVDYQSDTRIRIRNFLENYYGLDLADSFSNIAVTSTLSVQSCASSGRISAGNSHVENGGTEAAPGRPSSIPFAGAKGLTRSEWVHVEQFVADVGRHLPHHDEVRFLTYLTVTRSDIIVRLWKEFGGERKSSASGTGAEDGGFRIGMAVKRIKSIYGDYEGFHEFENSSQSTLSSSTAAHRVSAGGIGAYLRGSRASHVSVPSKTQQPSQHHHS